jgi:hypothetical protein
MADLSLRQHCLLILIIGVKFDSNMGVIFLTACLPAAPAGETKRSDVSKTPPLSIQ